MYENVHFNVTLHLGTELISCWNHHTIVINNIFHYGTNHFVSIKSKLQPFLISTSARTSVQQRGRQSCDSQFKFLKTRHVRKWSKSSNKMINFEEIIFLPYVCSFAVDLPLQQDFLWMKLHVFPFLMANGMNVFIMQFLKYSRFWPWDQL